MRSASQKSYSSSLSAGSQGLVVLKTCSTALTRCSGVLSLLSHLLSTMYPKKVCSLSHVKSPSNFFLCLKHTPKEDSIARTSLPILLSTLANCSLNKINSHVNMFSKASRSHHFVGLLPLGRLQVTQIIELI